MTINYLDSKRISALSSDVIDTATFEDDFDYASQSLANSAWVPNNDEAGNRVNISTDKLDFNFTMDSTNETIVHDLTSTSDTKWVLRFKANWSTLTASASNQNWFGLSDGNQTEHADSSQKGIGFIPIYTSGTQKFITSSPNNQNPIGTNDTAGTYALTTGVDLYVTITRTSATVYTVDIRTGSHSGTVVENFGGNQTCNSQTGLRYIKFSNNATQSEGGVQQGTIDDVEFYNGVSSLTNKPTNVQDNSILVEKDTARRYWRTPDQATVSDDLTTNKGWTATGTGNGYNASDYIDFKMVSPDASSGSDRDTVYIDLQDADYLNGSNISDSAFVVRCKINFSALANASVNENRNYFGFFSDDAWGGTAQDFFVLQVLATTSALSFIVGCSNNTTMEGGQDKNGTAFTATPTINTDYYVTFTRDGTSFKCRITTNSDYSGGQEMSATTTSNISNLRYFGWKGRGDTQANGGNTQGTIKPDIRIYNAVTSATPATWTGNIDLTGLKSYYNFEQTSTTLTNMATSVGSTDSLGSSGDATGSGTITKGATGIVGNAWDFGGGKVTTSHQLIPTSGDWTYSTWVSLDDISTAGEEILRHESPTFEVWRNSGGLNVSGASGTINLETASNLANNIWYNIVLVHSSSGDISYLNGVSKSTADITSVPTGTTWYLGGRSGSGEAINGKIDETTVWSRALSSSEVSGLYNSGRGKIVY